VIAIVDQDQVMQFEFMIRSSCRGTFCMELKERGQASGQKGVQWTGIGDSASIIYISVCSQVKIPTIV